jgi:8-oxo-dGTP pyrophosphatase MutT (NUDIX family)
MSEDRKTPTGPSPFRLVTSREVYRNPWINVREDRVIREGGAEGIFGVVTMRAGSSVLAITDDLQTFLTCEYKYAIARESLEVASGALEDGELPLNAAKRELEEELGLRADEWIDMGRLDPFTTVVSSPNYMFVALGLKATSQKLDAGEVLSIVKLPFLEAVELVSNGRISHGASSVLILKTNALLRNRGLVP